MPLSWRRSKLSSSASSRVCRRSRALGGQWKRWHYRVVCNVGAVVGVVGRELDDDDDDDDDDDGTENWGGEWRGMFECGSAVWQNVFTGIYGKKVTS